MALTATAFATTTSKLEENSSISHYIIDILSLADEFMATSEVRV